jgi:hypothetical protein
MLFLAPLPSSLTRVVMYLRMNLDRNDERPTLHCDQTRLAGICHVSESFAHY